jgi:hypothetical protein
MLGIAWGVGSLLLLVGLGTRSATYGVSGAYAGYGRMRKMDVPE